MKLKIGNGHLNASNWHLMPLLAFLWNWHQNQVCFSPFSGFAIKCHDTLGDSSDDTLTQCPEFFDSCGTITQEGNHNLPSTIYRQSSVKTNQLENNPSNNTFQYSLQGGILQPWTITYLLCLLFDLDTRASVFASTTNLEAGPRFAEICNGVIIKDKVQPEAFAPYFKRIRWI